MVRRRSPRSSGLALALILGLTMGGSVAHADVSVEHGAVRSFDSRKIAYSYFKPPAASEQNPVPVIFIAHEWGDSRIKDQTHPWVKMFTDENYAVLTWDARGFGESHGEVNFDAQDFEVRDVQALLDAVVARPEIATDDQDRDEVKIIPCPEPQPSHSDASVLPPPAQSLHKQLFPPPSPTEEPTETPEEGCTIEVHIHVDAMDPKVGMYGAGYGGTISLMTAAADPRVDAIVPMLAWHDLPQSLKPNGVIKLNWDLLLYAGGLPGAVTGGLGNQEPNSFTEDPNDTMPVPEAGSYAPEIHQAFAEAMATNDWSSATYSWFDARSPKHYIDGAEIGTGAIAPGISAATLIMHGVNDTLFPLSEAIKNYNAIKRRVGAQKAKFIAYCGGHTGASVNSTAFASTCEAGEGQQAALEAAAVKWMRRWVKRDTSVDTGPPVEFATQSGVPAGGSFRGRAGIPTTYVEFDDLARLKHQPAPTSGAVMMPTATGCDRPDYSDAPAGRDCTFTDASLMPVVTKTGPPKPGSKTPTPQFLQPGTIIFGAPKLRVGVTGTSQELYFFFKLVDFDPATKTRKVIDDQVTPLKVVWPSEQNVKWITFEMAPVLWQVPEGHEVYIEVTPSSNTHANSRVQAGLSQLIVNAKVPVIPRPRVFTPRVAPRGAFSNLRPALLAGTSEANALIEVIKNDVVIASGVAKGVGEDFPCPGNESFRCNWSVAAELPDGQHVVTIRATEPGGYAEPMLSPPFTFTVDTVAPIVPTIVAPAEGATTASRVVTFEGVAEKGTRVRIKDDGKTVGSVLASGAIGGTVAVTDSGFGPTPITIGAGGKVTWNWPAAPGTTSDHQIQSVATGAGAWNSPKQKTGKYEKTFSAPGIYDYYCTVVPGMTGQVIVENIAIYKTSYEYQLDQRGTRTIFATSTDDAGNVTTSANRTFIVP